MDTLIQADIFFFITAVSVIFLTLLSAVALFYIIRILRNVDHLTKKTKEEAAHLSETIRYITTRLREETDRIVEDVEEVRSLAKKGLQAKTVLSVVKRFLHKKSSRTKSTKKENTQK